MTRFTPQWLQSGSYAASQDRRLIGALWPTPACSGCAVSAGAGMQLNVAAGQVAVPTPNGTGTTLCTSDNVEQVNLTAAPGAGLNRIDLVTCHPRGADLDGGANNDFIFDFVTGVAAASPAVPATPAGQVVLAQVYVGGGVAAIVAANITDVRPFGLAIGGAPALPPPLAAGAALQSWTDSTGEVWVAKGGVNGGIWRRARDCVRAHYYRQAAMTIGTGTTLINFDTQTRDDYGLYNASQFSCPVSGVYRVSAFLVQSATATNVIAQIRVYVNAATVIGWAFAQSSQAGSLSPWIDMTWEMQAGQSLGIYGASGLAIVTGIATFMDISYRGPI